MNEPSRERLYRLLEGSNTFKAGQAQERDRVRLLIRIRIEQLRGTHGIRNREQMCAELNRILELIEP